MGVNLLMKDLFNNFPESLVPVHFINVSKLSGFPPGLNGGLLVLLSSFVVLHKKALKGFRDGVKKFCLEQILNQ